MCVWCCVRMHSLCGGRGWKIAYGTFIMRDPKTELSKCLHHEGTPEQNLASAFTHWAVSLALPDHFLERYRVLKFLLVAFGGLNRTVFYIFNFLLEALHIGCGLQGICLYPCSSSDNCFQSCDAPALVWALAWSCSHHWVWRICWASVFWVPHSEE